MTTPRLAALTTSRVGGAPAGYTQAHDAESVIRRVRALDDNGLPVLILAGGSNMLVSDDLLPQHVVHIVSRGVTVGDIGDGDTVTVSIEAGHPWDEVVALAVDRGWSGIEALSGIPGSAGATPVQNVSAYGQDIGSVLQHITVYDRVEQRTYQLTHDDLALSYRTSVLKENPNRWVVLNLTISLRVHDTGTVRYADLASYLGIDMGQSAPISQIRRGVLHVRGTKGMVLAERDHDTWSTGSFFTNPLLTPESAQALPSLAPRYPDPSGMVKTSAAWLVEQAGFAKGYGLPGPASLSTKHTLALTNRGNARSNDLLALAHQVRQGVLDTFGVVLHPEPVLVGCSLPDLSPLQGLDQMGER